MGSVATGMCVCAAILVGSAGPVTAGPVGAAVSSAIETREERESRAGEPGAATQPGFVFEARVSQNSGVCGGYHERDGFVNAKGSVVLADLPHRAPRVVEEDSVIGIAFFDKASKQPLSVFEATRAGGTRIRVRLGQVHDLVIDSSDARYSAYFSETLGASCIPVGYQRELRAALRGLSDEAPIVVEVANGTSSASRFAQRRNGWDPYGLNVGYNGVLGVWFPVGLFATNLQTTDGSLEFSAMPIGVAAGGRAWINQDLYVGFSAVANWSISSVAEPAGDGTADSDKVTKVAGVGLGALVDVSSLFYLGGMYVVDFGGDDPGPMLTVGVGPGLIKLLTELRQTKPSE